MQHNLILVERARRGDMAAWERLPAARATACTHILDANDARGFQD